MEKYIEAGDILGWLVSAWSDMRFGADGVILGSGRILRVCCKLCYNEHRYRTRKLKCLEKTVTHSNPWRSNEFHLMSNVLHEIIFRIITSQYVTALHLE